MRTIPGDIVGQPNLFAYLVPGRWYDANQWGPGDVTYNRAISANTLYVTPFYVGRLMKIDGLGARVYTAYAGGLFRLGIYASKKDVRLPGSLIVQTGELTAASTGVKTEIWTVPVVLSSGFYFLAFIANNPIDMYTMWGNPFAYGIRFGADGLTPNDIHYLYASQTYGPLPDPATTPTAFGCAATDGRFMPNVSYRILPNLDWVAASALQIGLTPNSLYSARTGDYAVVGGGGKSGNAYINEMDGFNFPTEGWYDITSVLAMGRNMLAGFNSSTRGYFAGGNPTGTTYTAEIDGIRFSDETAINPSVGLAVARMGLGGINSSTRGYCGGGYNSTNGVVAEIDGLQFSDETQINPSATLGGARYWMGSGVNSSTKGYWGGGRDASYLVQATIYSLQFSDETGATLSAVLKTARYGLSGLNSTTKGYWGGGVNASSGYEGEIDGIQFSDETAIDPGAAISLRYSMASYNSMTRGYWAGGYYGASPYYQMEIDGIQFSDETAVNPSAGLNNNVYGVERLAGVQSGGIL